VNELEFPAREMADLIGRVELLEDDIQHGERA
jgi:hypothetical protein